MPARAGAVEQDATQNIKNLNHRHVCHRACTPTALDRHDPLGGAQFCVPECADLFGHALVGARAAVVGLGLAGSAVFAVPASALLSRPHVDRLQAGRVAAFDAGQLFVGRLGGWAGFSVPYYFHVFYQQHGFECSRKFGDYLCLREDLAALKGNRFKSKRALVNYFEKHTVASY
ncbi:MAG: hypothetical protein Q7T22_12450, partial [Serpentinimonas sp.]|nr:hypothetical protein [Serpentinimonas sp.]